MAFVFESGRHPNRYLYLGYSYRDFEGRPRNRRVRVGRADVPTGCRVYLPGVVGADEIDNIVIQPELKARIAEEDQEARESNPELFGEGADQRRREILRLRRRLAPMFTINDLEGAVSLEGGVFSILGRASARAGLLGSLMSRLPDSWQGIYALGAFLASRDEGIDAADLWLKGSEGPEADLTPAGVRAIVEGMDMRLARMVPADMAAKAPDQPLALYPLGDGGAPLAVGSRTWLPVDPFREGGPSPAAPLVIPSFEDAPPANMRELVSRVGAEYYVCEAYTDLVEAVRTAPDLEPESSPSPLRGGAIRFFPEEAGGGPVWLMVGNWNPDSPACALSNAVIDPAVALGHLSLRPYLEQIRIKADLRLSECLGRGWRRRLGDQARIVKFVAMSLASLAWRAWRSSAPLRELPPSEVLRQLAGIRRLRISRVCYTRTLTEIQKVIFLAFGHSESEVASISGQARPLADCLSELFPHPRYRAVRQG
ncbi:MAG: hypothetical protein LBT40_16770 [Deltaproteobacteria bacterium]|nr:hypothetical protein [Deltaproteobacteria bacterium]